MDYEEMFFRSLETIEELREEIEYLQSEIRAADREIAQLQNELADNDPGRGYYD